MDREGGAGVEENVSHSGARARSLEHLKHQNRPWVGARTLGWEHRPMAAGLYAGVQGATAGF